MLSGLYSETLKDVCYHARAIMAPPYEHGNFIFVSNMSAISHKQQMSFSQITPSFSVQHMELKQIFHFWPGSLIYSRCYATVCLKWMDNFVYLCIVKAFYMSSVVNTKPTVDLCLLGGTETDKTICYVFQKNTKENVLFVKLKYEVPNEMCWFMAMRDDKWLVIMFWQWWDYHLGFSLQINVVLNLNHNGQNG